MNPTEKAMLKGYKAKTKTKTKCTSVTSAYEGSLFHDKKSGERETYPDGRKRVQDNFERFRRLSKTSDVAKRRAVEVQKNRIPNIIIASLLLGGSSPEFTRRAKLNLTNDEGMT